jgi:ribose transport system substrate-binding protein
MEVKFLMRIRKTAYAVAAVGTIAALLSACSSSSSSSAGSGSTASSQTSSSPGLAEAKALEAQYASTPTTIPQTVPLPKTPPKGKTIIYLVDNSVVGNVRVGQGVGAAAQAVGWNFHEVDYSQANPATLQQAFRTALQMKPTAVACTACDEAEWGSSVIASYKTANVPIIVDALGPYATTPLILGDPGGTASFQDTAKAIASWFVSDSNGHGKAVVANIPGLTVLHAWDEAFQQEVTTLCPGCSIKAVQVSVDQAIGGQEPQLLVSNLLRNRDYNYLIFDDGNFATGINSALSAAGLSGIKIAGSDGLTQEFAALRTGAQSVWTGQDQPAFGYGDVDYALRWVEGVAQTANNNKEPTQLLTPSNIGSRQYFVEPADALAQYEKLWKVPVTS